MPKKVENTSILLYTIIVFLDVELKSAFIWQHNAHYVALLSNHGKEIKRILCGGALKVYTMSWSNPSPEEAANAYSYYKTKYCNAANQKYASEKQEQSYVSQKSSASSRMRSLSSEKVNFEKRLNGIVNIIKMLEGNGGWFAVNVPSTISKVSSALSKTDSSYRNSIKMTGGVAAASLESAFKAKSVDSDINSATALQRYKTEKARLEQEIANLNTQITTLTNTISTLTSKINACNATQASLRSSMNSYAYEMNHYKKYMY